MFPGQDSNPRREKVSKGEQQEMPHPLPTHPPTCERAEGKVDQALVLFSPLCRFLPPASFPSCMWERDPSPGGFLKLLRVQERSVDSDSDSVGLEPELLHS